METGVHGALLLPHAFFPLMHPSLASKRCWECPAGGQHRCSWAGWLAVLGPSSPLAAQGSMEARRRTGVGCGFFSCCFLAFCPLSYDRKWYFAKQLAAQQLGAQEGWEKQCGVWDGGGVLPLLPQSLGHRSGTGGDGTSPAPPALTSCSAPAASSLSLGSSQLLSMPIPSLRFKPGVGPRALEVSMGSLVPTNPWPHPAAAPPILLACTNRAARALRYLQGQGLII